MDNRLFCVVKKTIATNDNFARHIFNKPLLQEVIESMDHRIIFYPKFHPELNFIERIIGALLNDIHENIAITLGTI